MKFLMTAVALASLAASPAFAAPARHVTHHTAAMASNAYAQEPIAYAAQDPDAVYFEGQYIGRDPDPSIRLYMMRDPGLPGN